MYVNAYKCILCTRREGNNKVHVVREYSSSVHNKIKRYLWVTSTTCIVRLREECNVLLKSIKGI